MIRGQEVWIIGATQGLGLALARLCAQQGRYVVGMARRPDPPNAFDSYQIIDVRDADSVGTTIAAAYATGGAPQMIICCAALCSQGSIMELEDAGLSAEVETNYLGFVRICQAVARFKPANQTVQLVAVGSTLGYVGCPSTDNYSATKAALISFARSAREELAPLGIDVLILSPPHMENGVDLIGPARYSLDWSAKRLLRAAEHGRHEYLLGAGNRIMARMSRWTPGLARSIMHAIGRDALKRQRGKSTA